jgi:membrane protease YdiL (CAAX protease family)
LAATAALPLAERRGISPVMFGLISLAGIFVLYQVVGGLATYLLLGALPGEGEIGVYRLTTSLGEILLVLLPALLLVRMVTLRPGEFLRLRTPDIRAVLITIAGIFSLQQILQIYLVVQDKIPLPAEIQNIVRQFRELFEELYTKLLTANSAAELTAVILVVALVPAVTEELLFRGLIQRSFEKGLGPARGIALTGIIFGAYHLNPFSFVPLAVLGIYLGFIAYRANSIWVSVAAHFYNNAMACFASYFHMDQDAVVLGNPEKLSPMILIGTALFFGAVFAASTAAFIRVTAPAGGAGEVVS